MKQNFWLELLLQNHPMKKSSLTALPTDYKDWLTRLKTRIQGARQHILLAANQTQIRLYYEIGREILERQEQQGWGARVIDRLSADLREAFPDMKGLSASNLRYMKLFAQRCPDRLFVQRSAAQLNDHQICQQSADQSPDLPAVPQSVVQLDNHPLSPVVADQLPWFHIILLLGKVSEPTEREWYARQAVQNGWSRMTLESNIKNRLFQRQGTAITNFAERLPAPHSDLAVQILKDPYHFDFLGLGDEAHERDIENALMRHITRFLLELVP